MGEAQDAVKEAQEARESRLLAGQESPRYLFDNNVLGDEAVSFDGESIAVANQRVSLVQSNPFED